MNEIITITSGLDQVGKTHLGINIALELTRIGHGVAYYHEGGDMSSLNHLVQLVLLVLRKRGTQYLAFARERLQAFQHLECDKQG